MMISAWQFKDYAVYHIKLFVNDKVVLFLCYL